MNFNLLEELEALEAQSGSLPPLNGVIALDRIEEDPDQPRKQFDPAELEALAASIRERGVIQPISVWPPNAGGMHRIIAGGRRFRAARLVGLTEIPAVIRKDGNREDQMIENIQRENLSHSEIGQWICEEIGKGRKPSDLGKALGKSRSWVSHYARYGELPAEIAALVDTIGMQTANILCDAWRINGDATKAWIEATETITQARAAAFKAGLMLPPDECAAPNQNTVAVGGARFDEPGSKGIGWGSPGSAADRPSRGDLSEEEPTSAAMGGGDSPSAAASSPAVRLPVRSLLVDCTDGSGLLDLEAFPEDPEFGYVHFGDVRREMRLTKLTAKRLVTNARA